MSKSILVNGRFKSQAITGVQRYATEITTRLNNGIKLIHSPQFRSPLSGHVWEQFYLPTKVSSTNMLWSPANTGPIAVKNQIVTIHDLSPIDHPEWFDRNFSYWYRFLLPKLAQRVKLIFTDSEFSKARIMNVFGLAENKVVSIPLGVGDQFKPATQANVDAVTNKLGILRPYVLYIGSLEPRKNLLRLFQAWELVDEHRVELVVAGMRGRSFKDSGFDKVPSGVRMTGYVPDQDLPSLYTGALCFIYLSIYEGFGLPVLEAMSCGVPVISSNSTALPEVVGDAGLLLDPFDVVEIASTLKLLISDREQRDELQAKGFERAALYSWDKTTEIVWKELQSLA